MEAYTKEQANELQSHDNSEDTDRDENTGEGIPHDLIRDECLTILFAGHGAFHLL